MSTKFFVRTIFIIFTLLISIGIVDISHAATLYCFKYTDNGVNKNYCSPYYGANSLSQQQATCESTRTSYANKSGITNVEGSCRQVGGEDVPAPPDVGPTPSPSAQPGASPTPTTPTDGAGSSSRVNSDTSAPPAQNPAATPLPSGGVTGTDLVSEYQFLAPLKDAQYDAQSKPDFVNYLKLLYRLAISLAVVLAVLMIVYGGILYMSTDAITGKKDGKEIIVRTLWGLLLIMAAWIILYSLNRTILDATQTGKSLGEVGQQAATQQTVGYDQGGLSDPGLATSTLIPGISIKNGVQGRGSNPGQTFFGNLNDPTGAYGGTTGVYGQTPADAGVVRGGFIPRTSGDGFVPPSNPGSEAGSGGTAGYTPGGTVGGGSVPWGNGSGQTNGAGFTDLTPPADAQIIYVSSSQGNDGNQGSSNAPVQSLSAAVRKLRNGSSDQILLKAGDSFSGSINLNVSGKSPHDPIVIGSYGTGARPIIRSGANGIGVGFSKDQGNIAITGIHFIGNNGTGRGIGGEGVEGIHDVLIEDCYIEAYRVGIGFSVTTGSASIISNPIQSIVVRRSIIADNYSGGGGHSQGMYLENVVGALIEENVFDHNGWGNGKPATIFNHNMYINGLTADITVRGNISSNASSHGLQARSGGIVEGNFLYQNPFHMTYGLVNGEGHPTPRGVSGRIKFNVMLRSGKINGGNGGLALQVANITNAEISNNIIAHNTAASLQAIGLDRGRGNYENDAVGIHNLTINDNIVQLWPGGLTVAGEYSRGDIGSQSISNVVLTNNDFPRVLSRDLLTIRSAVSNPSYPNPGRMNDLYDSLIQNAKSNSRANWNPNYTAAAAVKYIQEGFGK